MKFKPYKATEYTNIFADIDNGMTVREIAEKHKRTVSAIFYIKSIVDRYKKGDPSVEMKAYERVLKKLRVYYNGKQVKVPEKLSTDHYAVFKQKNEDYQQAIEQFIEKEVAQRVAAIVAENTKLRQTVERLNKENDAYQKAFVEAKNANWVDALKKKWKTI